MKAVYPCILTQNKEDKCYYADFPDIQGASTSGADLFEALEMAEDILPLMLIDYEAEHDGHMPPVPTDIHTLELEAGQTATFLRADTDKYEAEMARIRREKVYRNGGMKP